MTESPTPADEYFEHIPWDELMAEVDARRRVTLRWAAGVTAVVVVAAGVFVAGRPAPDPMPVTTVTATVPSTIPPPPVTEPSTVTTSSRVWAEADLRAVPPGELERRAAAYAEWVLRDLFSRPRDDQAGAESSTADSPSGTRSFVEWVSVLSVSELDPGRFRVEAAVGRLEAPPGEEYRRIPPEAFAVVVDVSADPPTIVDLPIPVPVVLPAVGDVGGEPAAPPSAVAEAATEMLGRFGTVDDVEAFRVGARWRVVGSVTDAAGVAWPMVVWLDEDGHPVDPAG